MDACIAVAAKMKCASTNKSYTSGAQINQFPARTAGNFNVLAALQLLGRSKSTTMEWSVASQRHDKNNKGIDNSYK